MTDFYVPKEPPEPLDGPISADVNVYKLPSGSTVELCTLCARIERDKGNALNAGPVGWRCSACKKGIDKPGAKEAKRIMMHQAMYDEFGQVRVDRKRRELTAKNNKVPSYIELYAALSSEAEWSTPPLDVQPGEVLKSGRAQQRRLL